MESLRSGSKYAHRIPVPAAARTCGKRIPRWAYKDNDRQQGEAALGAEEAARGAKLHHFAIQVKAPPADPPAPNSKVKTR